MDIKINKKIYKKKKLNSFHLSLGFMFFTILLTAGLYIYNFNLENKNNDLNIEIGKKESSINELEKQPKIIAYSLYDSNKSTITKLEDYSRVSIYIKHLLELKRKYNIDFKGFKYSSGNLKTQVISSSDSNGINYEKTVNFIKNYRLNKDLSSLFDLKLVKSVLSKNEGVSNVFVINLKLKNNIGNIFKKANAKQIEINKLKEEEKLKKQKLIKEKIKAAKLKKEIEKKNK